jgi:selenide,water dikinase
MKRLLLLGGGHAHVQVLRSMAREPMAGAMVQLVSPYPKAVYSGMVPGLAAGHYQAGDCLIDLRALADAAHVPFVQAAATAIDAAGRQVGLDGGDTLGYDVLSVDTGSVMRRDVIDGAREHALFVRPMEAFVRLLDELLALARTRALDVVLVGGGAAALELAMALQYRFVHEQVGSRVTLVAGAGPLLAGYPLAVRRRAALALRRRRITVLHENCVHIDATHVQLANGARVPCDAGLLAIGAHAPRWLAGSGLALDARGFIATRATLQSSSHAEVFAVGDVASRSDAPHPKSGVYAVRAAAPLLHNLRRFVGGGTLRGYAPPQRTLNLLSCGGREAIASWGEVSASGRWCWWWKDRIDRAFIERFRRPA